MKNNAPLKYILMTIMVLALLYVISYNVVGVGDSLVSPISDFSLFQDRDMCESTPDSIFCKEN